MTDDDGDLVGRASRQARMAMLTPDTECERAVRERSALAAMLDCAHDALMLLDRDAKVAYRNRRAAELLARATAITQGDDDRLVVVNVNARNALGQALYRCVVEPDAGIARVAIARGHALPLVLMLQPFLPRWGDQDAPMALATLIDPESAPQGHAKALELAFGLTPAEARLAEALNNGMTLRQFAALGGLSYETVRSYLKRVLVKTGARNQADLMRLARSVR